MNPQTTDDYAVQISESLINGQHRQARDQFKRALHDACDPYELLSGIAEVTTADRALRFAATLINRN